MTLPGLAEILKAHEEALEKGREMAAAQEHPEKLAKLLEEQRAAERLRLNHRIDSLVKGLERADLPPMPDHDDPVPMPRRTEKI